MALGAGKLTESGVAWLRVVLPETSDVVCGFTTA